jgi:1-deoxy-D-xylulose-5-phosphate synthase
MVVMAPADEHDLTQMLEFALDRNGPTAIRYPKASLPTIEGTRTPVEFGKNEILSWNGEGAIISCGAMLPECLKAADKLREEGVHVGVINARFVKPLDRETIGRAIRECGFVVTVEEGVLAGGFGSAVLEFAADAGLDTSRVRRLGIPDAFVEHGERNELLADLGLDANGIAAECRRLATHHDGGDGHPSAADRSAAWGTR